MHDHSIHDHWEDDQTPEPRQQIPLLDPPPAEYVTLAALGRHLNLKTPSASLESYARAHGFPFFRIKGKGTGLYAMHPADARQMLRRRGDNPALADIGDTHPLPRLGVIPYILLADLARAFGIHYNGLVKYAKANGFKPVYIARVQPQSLRKKITPRNHNTLYSADTEPSSILAFPIDEARTIAINRRQEEVFEDWLATRLAPGNAQETYRRIAATQKEAERAAQEKAHIGPVYTTSAHVGLKIVVESIMWAAEVKNPTGRDMQQWNARVRQRLLALDIPLSEVRAAPTTRQGRYVIPRHFLWVIPRERFAELYDSFFAGELPPELGPGEEQTDAQTE